MTIDEADLPGPVLDAGVLAGLLLDGDTGVTINLAWFKDPFASASPSLANLGARLGSLVSIINAVLQPAAINPAATGGGQWFALPDPGSDGDLPLYLVVPKGTTTSGQIGIGAQCTFVAGNAQITLFAYIPLLAYTPNGAQFLVAGSAVPSQIGLEVTTVDGKGFTTQGVSFTSLEVAASLCFDGDAYGSQGLPASFAMTFGDLTNTSAPATYTSLLSLGDSNVADWIGEVIVQASAWLDTPIGDTPVSFGSVLVAAGFLSTDDNGDLQFDLDQIQGLSAEQVALQFLFGTMSALSASSLPCPAAELPGGGLYFISRANADATTDYGLRLALDIPVTQAGDEGAGPASPAVTLSLGAWFDNEDESDNWLLRSTGGPAGSAEPGLELTLIRVDEQMNVTFAPNITLSSVGMDIEGGSSTPLVSVGGFTLDGAELRFYLDTNGVLTLGGGAKLDGLGLPLAPGFGTVVQGTSTNPVAQDLVGSGSVNGGGEQGAVNPSFSLSAGYVQGGSLTVQLYDAAGAPAEEVTLPIQRGVGPVLCQSLGIGWVADGSAGADDRLSLLVNGSVALGPLAIDLAGLTVDIPVATPGDLSSYDLDLSGLGLVFSAGEVTLSAALVKVAADPNATPPRAYAQYDGQALIQAGDVAIDAVGSYAYATSPDGSSGYTSLFIFAVVDAIIGGPEFFFVTGLAAGFGYNRTLLLPDQAGVPAFPLVAAASDPSSLGATKGSTGSWQMPDPATALAALDRVVQPQRGEYWLAAGVRFTSFDLINSTALLIVEFGNELEITLLGTSSISLPPPPAPGSEAPAVRYAYGELGIEIKLLPSQGVFSATAILTPNSFVIDPACKLTGGFAFYVWFGSSPQAGQFVLTMGGYHPDFQPPSYFPSVPRLGFSWPMEGGLTISGDAYFALTPSAVMTGGGLSIVYSAGNLRAWLLAQMDALIEWAPFSYQLRISVCIGASYRIHLLFLTTTLRVELSAQLALWGPPMGGTMRISFYVVSITVDFGAPRNASPVPLSWTDENGAGFAQTLLPHAGAAQQAARPAAGDGLHATVRAAEAAQPAGICVVTASAGLLTTITGNGQSIWVVRPDAFVFALATAIPATAIDLANSDGTNTAVTPASAGGGPYTLCIRPMRATLASSTLQVSLENNDDGTAHDIAAAFDFIPSLQQVPAAKWGAPVAAGSQPEPNALLPGRLMGLTGITAKAPALLPSGTGLLAIDLDTSFTFDVVDEEQPYTSDHLPLSTAATPSNKPPVPDPAILGDIQVSLMDASVATTRSAVFAALQTMGVAAATNGSLAILAGSPGAWMTGAPLLASAS